MDDVNIPKLISLVEARPAIYDKKSKHYYDRQNRQMLWLEVCEILLPAWPQLTQSEKTKTSVKIQSRWQNLRACFRREYNRQQGVKPDEDYIKRKKYGYFDQLRFILPTTNDEGITINDTTSSIITTSSKIEQNEEQETPVITRGKSPNVKVKAEKSPLVSKKKAKQKKNYKERVFEVLDTKNTEEVDEDKHFVLSLVPSLRRMTNSQKLKVKMKFLQAINDIEDESRQSMSSSPV